MYKPQISALFTPVKHCGRAWSWRDKRPIKKSVIKMEWRGPCWLRPSDKKASEVTKQFSPTLVPSTRLPSLSLSSPSFTPLSPWTEDWHSAEDTPGWRLKEVELMCEFKRQWTKGGKRGGGVELVAGSEWLTQFLMECRHSWLTIFLSPISCSPLILFLSIYLPISILCSLAGLVTALLPSHHHPPFLQSSLALLFYISSFRLLWLLRPRADPSPHRMMGSTPSYRGYLLSASIHIAFLWLWVDGFHIGPLYWLTI